MPFAIMSVHHLYHPSGVVTEIGVSVKSELGVTDVSFESADGKVFHLQRKYLEMNTGGFPPTEFDTQGSDPVQLTESSVVLEALFRFAYPVTQPDLEDVSFEVIAAVAEAAEKYIVFSAMNFCRLRMRFDVTPFSCYYLLKVDSIGGFCQNMLLKY